jgi:hypothetical protein
MERTSIAAEQREWGVVVNASRSPFGVVADASRVGAAR